MSYLKYCMNKINSIQPSLIFFTIIFISHFDLIHKFNNKNGKTFYLCPQKIEYGDYDGHPDRVDN